MATVNYEATYGLAMWLSVVVVVVVVAVVVGVAMIVRASRTL